MKMSTNDDIYKLHENLTPTQKLIQSFEEKDDEITRLIGILQLLQLGLTGRKGFLGESESEIREKQFLENMLELVDSAINGKELKLTLSTSM